MLSEDVRSLLLNGLNSGAGPETLLQQVMDQAAVDDPAVEMLVKYLNERKQAETSSDEPVVDDTALADERIQQLTETLQDLSQKFERVYAEVEELRQEKDRLNRKIKRLRRNNQTMAAALGICPECLGESAGCPVCGGQGYPGSTVIPADDELFWYFVAPAVRTKHRASGQSAGVGHS